MIELPCAVGDKIFVIVDWNPCKDYSPGDRIYLSIYGHKIVMLSLVAEGFIIDSDGVHFAENSQDGWNLLETYNDLTTEEYGPCKVFTSFKEAFEFINSIRIQE